MPLSTRQALNLFLAAAACWAAQARASDADALDLQAAPAAEPVAESPLRAFLEIGVGRIQRNGGLSTQDGQRASLDLRYATRLGDDWRLTLSDRLDVTHPAPEGQKTTVNSLREAFVAWQEPGGSRSFDLGRINLRQGPAYGYNPTDYFRTGALRTITTADPVALREMRMGTVMARLGQSWAGGSVSLALAPKLESEPDRRSASLDLGATNQTDRALLALDARLSQRLSGQASLLLQRGSAPRVGASATGLLSDSVVAYAEWSTGRSQSLLDQVLVTAAPDVRNQQAALGLTFTLPGGLSLTAEGQTNGAGLDRDGWNQVLAQGAGAVQRYFALTQPSQELGSRRAWLLYASQKGLGLTQLDLTAFVKTNAVDQSRLAWAELRYHWPRFDLALQWQRGYGAADTEFGATPYRQIWQAVGVFFF